MRPYRGKRKDNGEWVYGWYSESWSASSGYNDIGSHIRWLDKEGNFHDEEVIPETVSQQVGLKDRDGIEEVYGNDLMKDLLHTYRVCWAELDAGFRLIDIEEPKNQLRGEAIRLLTKMGTIHDEEAEE